jgi:ABC-type nitrate/sulfonate/bicarbonate transport system substrate-binding protein
MNPIRFLVATLFFSFISCLGPASAQTAPTIYVGVVSVTPTNTPVLSAVEGGYFKKYGLDVKPLVMSGSSTALAALLSEEMSFITIAGSGVINAHLAGRDAVMIAGTVNYAPYEMVVSKDIKTVEDLKGKKLGIARFGGSTDFWPAGDWRSTASRPGRMSLSYKPAAIRNDSPQSRKARFKLLCSSSLSPTGRRKPASIR